MSAFQRRLDLLDHIPRYPRKISTRPLLEVLEAHGHEGLIMRKIQRDLEAIANLGMFGLEVDKRSKPYGWSINLNWKKLNISLMDANSALAFSTLKEVADTLLPESTLKDLSAYFEKAETIIESENSPAISHWKKSVALINNNNPVKLPLPDKEALTKIKQAIFHKKQISADLKRYLIANKDPVWKYYKKINPLGLIQRDDVVTLVCSFGSFNPKVIRLPIAFIRNVEINNLTTITPEHFDFEKIKNSHFTSNSTSEEMKLSLLARKDSLLVLNNGKLSEDQSVTESEYPELVKIQATVADTPKIRAFLRGLGTTIEVLEPLHLRLYFKKLAQDMLEKYQ